MKKNILDWVKLIIMVIAGITWIFISSSLGFFGQMIGMICFILSAYNWVCTDQAKNIISKLVW